MPGLEGAHRKDFPDLRLAYAQHVYKGLGLTANNSLALIGGWQTDREHAYVSLTRAREQTNIYTSKQNLGTQDMNTDAIERLAEKIAQSNAKQASITRQPVADRSLDQTAETTPDLQPSQTIEDGVGAAAPNGPDPSAELYDRDTTETNHERQPDREPNQLTHEQTDERDLEQVHDFGPGIE